MYASKLVLALAAGSLASAAMLAERVAMPFGGIQARSAMNGWSLQASSCPADSSSCGSGSCCPSGTTCNAAATAEVAACCTDGDCRGQVEGSPVCADASWSLWKGYNGNGFCCLVGQTGIYDYHTGVAGSCVDSAPAGATLAVQMSTGTGSSATTSASSSATSTVASTTKTSTAASSTVTTTSGTATASESTVSSVIVAATTASTTATGAARSSSTSSTTASASSATTAGSGAGRVGAGLAGVFGAVAFAAMM